MHGPLAPLLLCAAEGRAPAHVATEPPRGGAPHPRRGGRGARRRARCLLQRPHALTLGRRIPYIVLGAPLGRSSSSCCSRLHPTLGAPPCRLPLLHRRGRRALQRDHRHPLRGAAAGAGRHSGERVGLEAAKVYLGVAGTAIGLVGSDPLCTGSGSRRWRSRSPGSPWRASTCRSGASGTGPSGRAFPAESVSARRCACRSRNRRSACWWRASSSSPRLPAPGDRHPLLRPRRRSASTAGSARRCSLGRDRSGGRLPAPLFEVGAKDVQAACLPLVDARRRGSLPATRRGRVAAGLPASVQIIVVRRSSAPHRRPLPVPGPAHRRRRRRRQRTTRQPPRSHLLGASSSSSREPRPRSRPCCRPPAAARRYTGPYAPASDWSAPSPD